MRLFSCSFLLVILLIPCYFSIYAQDTSRTFTKEIQFANYLYHNKMQREGIILLKEIDRAKLNKDQQDSVDFLLGWSYYSLKDLEKSIRYFGEVRVRSSNYFQSVFFKGYNEAYLGKFAVGHSTIFLIKPTTPLLTELKQYELSGLALLNRDLLAFESYAANYTGQYFQLKDHEDKMIENFQRINNFKKKSMLAAGIFSAIIPGSGKVYAGKPYQGLSSFMHAATLGAVAYEGFKKNGFKSAQFYIFSSIFSIYYIANIWGSVLAVKIVRDEFNHEIEHKILFEMHIPLRTIFN